MDFLALVSPLGQLHKAWVAAHWERRLRRADYKSADIKAGVKLLTERLGSIPLGMLGHLLVGLCKILRQQGRYIKEDSDEVRTALRMSVEHGGALPSVPVLSEAAVSMSRPSRPSQAHRWERHADVFDMDDLDCPPLDLLAEPLDMSAIVDVDDDEVAAALEEGRRYVAPIDTITLPSEPAAALPASGGGVDAFDAPSPEEMAMSRASASAGRDKLGGYSGDELPPVDMLLGDASGALFHGLGDTSRTGSDAPGSREADDGFDPALCRSGPHSATPLRPAERKLQFSPLVDTRGSGEGLPGLGPLDRGLSYLPERLFDSPIPEDGPGGAARSSPAGAPAALGPSGVATATRHLGRLDGEELLGDGDASFDESPVLGGDAAAVVERPKKRRRLRKWLDEKSTQLTDEQYGRDSITRKPSDMFTLHLPHASIYGYTTTLSDVCSSLGEFFEHARTVGKRRRVARAEAAPDVSGGVVDAVLPPGAASASPSAPSERRRSEARGSPLLPGEELLRRSPSEQAHGSMSGLPTSPAAPTPLVTPGSTGSRGHPGVADGSRAGLSPSGEARGSAGQHTEGASASARHSASAASAAASASAAAEMHHDVSDDAAMSGELPAMPASWQCLPTTPGGAASPMRPRIGASPMPIAGESSPGVQEKIEAIDEVSERSYPEVRKQETQIREELASDDQVLSFLGLCQEPPSDAEAAARRFVDLLRLHGDGVVTLHQSEPHADIEIAKGRHFDDDALASPLASPVASPDLDA